MSTTDDLKHRRAELALRVEEGDTNALTELEEVERTITSATLDQERQRAAAQARADREAERQREEEERRRKIAGRFAKRLANKRQALAQKYDRLIDQAAETADYYLATCRDHQQAMLQAGEHRETARIARPDADAVANAAIYKLAAVLPFRAMPDVQPKLQVPLTERDPYVENKPNDQSQKEND